MRISATAVAGAGACSVILCPAPPVALRIAVVLRCVAPVAALRVQHVQHHGCVGHGVQRGVRQSGAGQRAGRPGDGGRRGWRRAACSVTGQRTPLCKALMYSRRQTVWWAGGMPHSVRTLGWPTGTSGRPVRGFPRRSQLPGWLGRPAARRPPAAVAAQRLAPWPGGGWAWLAPRRWLQVPEAVRHGATRPPAGGGWRRPTASLRPRVVCVPSAWGCPAWAPPRRVGGGCA